MLRWELALPGRPSMRSPCAGSKADWEDMVKVALRVVWSLSLTDTLGGGVIEEVVVDESVGLISGFSD